MNYTNTISDELGVHANLAIGIVFAVQKRLHPYADAGGAGCFCVWKNFNMY